MWLARSWSRSGWDWRSSAFCAPRSGGAAGTVEPVGFLGVRDQRQLIGQSLDLALRDEPFLFAEGGAPCRKALMCRCRLPRTRGHRSARPYGCIRFSRCRRRVDSGRRVTRRRSRTSLPRHCPLPVQRRCWAQGKRWSTPAVALSPDDWRLAIGSRLGHQHKRTAWSLRSLPTRTARSIEPARRVSQRCSSLRIPATAQTGGDGVAAGVAALPVGSFGGGNPTRFHHGPGGGLRSGNEEQIVVDASSVDTVMDGRLAACDRPTCGRVRRDQLVAKVVELQRDLEVVTFEQRHGGLQIVTLLARRSNRFALGLAGDVLWDLRL